MSTRPAFPDSSNSSAAAAAAHAAHNGTAGSLGPGFVQPALLSSTQP
ncbi:MAG: hypothetical protein E7G39_04900 [Bifidobacterium breve]|nr:hypothetical protein [Bifidobacterium breve]